MSEGLDPERLGQVFSLLGSAVLGDPMASEELVKNRTRFVERIRKIDLRILSGAASLLAVAGGLIFRDPFWILLLPFGALILGHPPAFRLLRLYGWILPVAAILAFLVDWEMGRVAVAVLALLGVSYLQTIPDLTCLSEKWFRLLSPSGAAKGQKNGGGKTT